ncbi:unnamed protein product [Schistocephalus solidus]|uniref:G_PROTEIN_RECEP_F1_2 domain-containing protein n=1 Tax=Schistocephalus solidus TaxID=70667 RepID=A0A183SXW0_SCHSO|nr:unnamed protein product [Schistocephalus solidus]
MAQAAKPVCRCCPAYFWTNGTDICAILLEIFGFLANLTVTVLLFRLRAKKVEGLALLRILSFSCSAFSLISFIEHVGARSAHTGNAHLDGLICVFWSTRFLFWFTIMQVCHSLFYFACNRAFEMLQITNHPTTTEKQRLTAYMLVVFMGSFIGTLPHLLLAKPHSKDCACAPVPENFAIQTVLYAHAFLWVVILGLIYPAVLVYICIALVLRLRSKVRGTLVDEIDDLSFLKPESSPGYLNTITKVTPVMPTSTHPDVCDGNRNSAGALATLRDGQITHVWSASFCVIPLTAAYITGTSFEWVHQLLSAAGFINYQLRSSAQQFSVTLMNLLSAFVPLIIFFHIPAMRSLIFVAISSLQTRCGKVRVMDAGDLPCTACTSPAVEAPAHLED